MVLDFRKKLIIPIITLILLSMSILGLILYVQTKKDIETQLIQQSQNELDTIEYVFNNQSNLGKSIEEEIGNSYISSAKSIAESITEDSSLLLPENIKLHSLRLQETETSFAEWFASDNE